MIYDVSYTLVMHESTYTYSRLSSTSVGNLMAIHYGLSNINSCKFYVLGLHDNYLIETDELNYILRIYRNDWRSVEEVRFELELLTFLAAKNVSVAAPLCTKSAESCFFIDSPEGGRAVALFKYTDGHAPGSNISLENTELSGKTVASVHQATAGFETKYTRQVLDVPYLLDDSIRTIEPFVGIDERNYLGSLQKRLKDALPSLSRDEGVYGVCIGDVNANNFHINGNNDITLFDFDQCGYGYRAFEIGKFISSIPALKNKRNIAQAFIDGYQQVRQLTQEEMIAIAYFEIISVIWVMAIHVYNADRIGYKALEKPFWERRLAILKELDVLSSNGYGGLTSKIHA